MKSSVDNSTATIFEEEILPKVLPFVIIISIITPFAVIGNAVIIYIFGFRLKGSTVHFFITLLAIFDIICCAIDFPMEIVEFHYILRYPSNANCKFQRLVAFTCTIGSTIMLLVISIERYRKVCCAVRSELSSLNRKIFAVGVVILSLVLASPIVVFSQRIQFPYHFFPITAAVCGVPSYESNPFPYYYMIAFFSFISIALIAMLIFYYQVWRTAKNHFEMAHNRQQKNHNSASAEHSMAKKRLNRTNRTLIATTVLFAVSFFLDTLLTILLLELPPFLYSFSAEVAYIAFLRLYILNSSFNPFVYGYFNEQFRYETKIILTKILRMKKPTIVDFSTENTN